LSIGNSSKNGRPYSLTGISINLKIKLLPKYFLALKIALLRATNNYIIV